MKKTGKTPYQYAEELVTEFKIVLMQEDTDCGCEVLCTLIAIKNALITVNRLMKATDKDYNLYLKFVTQELKKM